MESPFKFYLYKNYTITLFGKRKIGVGKSLEKSFYNLQQVPLTVDGAEEFPEIKADFFK